MPTLKKETIKAIEDAVVNTWVGPLKEGVDPEHVLRNIHQYIVNLLQLPDDTRNDFYVRTLGDSLKEVLGPIPEKTFSHRDIPPNRVHAMLTYGDEDES